MKNYLLISVLLLFVSGVGCQKPTEIEAIKGLDIFILGDPIAKYENKLTKTPFKTGKSTGDHYTYNGNEITSYLGLTIKRISLEFCSGKLKSVVYHFDDADPKLKQPVTQQETDQFKNKLIKQFGNSKMHNTNSMETDEKGGGGFNSESWTWISKTKMVSFTLMKTAYSKKNYISLSVLDRESLKVCEGK